MRITKSFNKNTTIEGKKIIIYGAGRYGELAYNGLQELNLKPECIIDKNKAGYKFKNCKIVGPENLKYYKNDIFLIASLNYFYEMLAILQEYEIENYYDIEELIKLCDDGQLSEYALDEKRNIQKYHNVVEYGEQDKIIIGHCEIVVTEKCTLKCRDCANLMQYYTKPENLDIDEIIVYFNNFLKTVDVLLELRILGGEPFINRNLLKLIETYKINDKIKRITIYTNSTIIPNEMTLKCLENEKISVHMSNYGIYSSKVEQLMSMLDKYNVNYYIHKYEKWADIGNLREREYSEQAIKKIFEVCLMSKCYTFYRGKFYVCPRAAHGERLNIFVNNTNEFVDFTSTDINIEQKKEELKKILSRKEPIKACNYCNGHINSNEIPAAIQI